MIHLAVVFQEVFRHGNHRGTSWYLWEIATWSSDVKVWVAKWLVWVNTMLEGQNNSSILATLSRNNKSILNNKKFDFILKLHSSLQSESLSPV